MPPNLPHAELATFLHFCLTLPSLRVPFLLCPTSNLYLTDFRSLVARPPRQLIQHSGCSCATRHEGNLRFIAPAWRQPRRWRGFSALLFLLFAACQRPRRLPSRTFPPPPPYATEPPARATAGPRHIQYVAFDAVLSVWGKVCVKRKFTSCGRGYVAACCLIPTLAHCPCLCCLSRPHQHRDAVPSAPVGSIRVHACLQLGALRGSCVCVGCSALMPDALSD